MPGLIEANPLYIVPDQENIASKLVVKLNAVGIKSELVEQLPKSASHVIYLAGINTLGSVNDAIAINKHAFTIARNIGQHMQSVKQGIFVTVQNTGGSFGLGEQCSVMQSWTAGLTGLAKTAKQEWPNIQVKCIDINSQSEEAADIIFNELLYGGADLEVGYVNKNNRIILQEADIQPTTITLPTKAVDLAGTMIITGGARGVTAHCLIQLLQQYPLKVAILGTTTLKDIPVFLEKIDDISEINKLLLAEAKQNQIVITPADLRKRCQDILAVKEINKNLAAMRQTGAQVQYYSVDVNNFLLVSKVLAEIRLELGDIKMLVHAAGTLADKLIHEKSDEQFDKVFNTKVIGLQNLLNATVQDQLTHIICFSSVAARTGNVGQVDYAMANEVLNKVCNVEAQRRSNTCIVKSIAWGPWDGGMVTQQLKAHFTEQGVGLISLAAGAQAFVNEFLNNYQTNYSEVVIGCDIEQWKAAKQSAMNFYDICLHPAEDEFINSHVIWNKTILPLVWVYDCALRLASVLLPNKQVICHKLEAKKALELSKFKTGADEWLRLHWQEKYNNNKHYFDCTLEKVSDQQVYFNFQLLPTTAIQSAINRHISNVGTTTKIARTKIYSTILFHKKHFHVIKDAAYISDLQITAKLKCNYVANNLQTNIFYLDGGLQLIVIWMTQRYGISSLPLSIDFVEIFTTEFISDEVNCEVQILQHNNFTVKADARFFNQAGNCIAVMCGVYCIVTSERFHKQQDKRAIISEV
jgi:NAD(P)-dependent dehydrogenase (short-subunit alcohol dehydrogenase family)